MSQKSPNSQKFPETQIFYPKMLSILSIFLTCPNIFLSKSIRYMSKFINCDKQQWCLLLSQQFKQPRRNTEARFVATVLFLFCCGAPRCVVRRPCKGLAFLTLTCVFSLLRNIFRGSISNVAAGCFPRLPARVQNEASAGKGHGGSKVGKWGKFLRLFP